MGYDEEKIIEQVQLQILSLVVVKILHKFRLIELLRGFSSLDEGAFYFLSASHHPIYDNP